MPTACWLFGVHQTVLTFVYCYYIQEVNKKLCIICPKHKYKITLAEGEGIYKACDPRQKDRTFKWFSKGIKQRVHTVTEQEEDVFVTLSNTSSYIESDYYYTEQGRKDREKVNDNMGIAPGSDEDDSWCPSKWPL